MKDLRESKKQRQPQALLPLTAYAGMTVSAPVFGALMAAYVIYAVMIYAIKNGIVNIKFHLSRFCYIY